MDRTAASCTGRSEWQPMSSITDGFYHIHSQAPVLDSLCWC